MRRILFLAVLGAAGCSTAPVADCLDLVAPGDARPSGGSELPPLPNGRAPADGFPPPPQPGRNYRNDPPAIPSVPSSYAPPPIEGDEGDPPARLRPRPMQPKD